MSLTFDLRDFQRVARQMQAFEEQIPFALARALNEAAEVARRELISTTWAQHITVRNPNFLKAALTTKGARATKRNLRVEIYDKLGRGNLSLHDQGGTRRGQGALAVPTSALASRRGSKGIPKGMRPKTLPKSFAKPGKSGDMLIFQRTGSYKKAGKRALAQDNRHLKLAYVLKPSTPIRADVPFHADFNRVMRREMPRQFQVFMQKAMETAFKRK